MGQRQARGDPDDLREAIQRIIEWQQELLHLLEDILDELEDDAGLLRPIQKSSVATRRSNIGDLLNKKRINVLRVVPSRTKTRRRD
jgi:hypothetical protein